MTPPRVPSNGSLVKKFIRLSRVKRLDQLSLMGTEL